MPKHGRDGPEEEAEKMRREREGGGVQERGVSHYGHGDRELKNPPSVHPFIFC